MIAKWPHPFMTFTQRVEGQAQVDTCGWGGESAPCGRRQKSDPTDVILSSSHAKKLAFFVPEVNFCTE